MMNWQEHITADPGILVGKPIIRGTRISVEFILDLLTEGWSETDITQNYNLSQAQVRACVVFAREPLITAPNGFVSSSG